MEKFGRNDPCPCGSGKKFKKCHMGHEDELISGKMGTLQEEAGKKITSLPEVSYGRAKEIADAIDMGELTGTPMGIKFIDLDAYLGLGFHEQDTSKDLHRGSGGLIVNFNKTRKSDPKRIYIAITPNINDSTLIHQLAHVLDSLGGSRLMPGTFYQLSLETEIPMEHLDHPKEFGDWLDYCKDRFNIELDAEDQIISFLHQHNMLLTGDDIKGGDSQGLASKSQKTITFLMEHGEEIDRLIRNRPGYTGKANKKGEE